MHRCSVFERSRRRAGIFFILCIFASVCPEDWCTASEGRISEIVRRLGRLKAGPETDSAVEKLAAQKDAAVDEIERQSAELRSDFVWVHTSVRVLEKVNSEKSRKLLRRIALGEIEVGNSNLQRWAARALLASDPAEVKALLSSTDRQVLEAAILSLQGRELDQELLDALSEQIESADPDTRWRAAHVMATEAPGGELARQALTGVQEALAAVSAIPDLATIDPSSGHVNFQMTVGEAQYQHYLGMLVKIRVDDAALREVAEQLKGDARDTVLLALSLRADRSVHKEIARIAGDPAAGMFRAWAASGLETIGGADDLPLLRRLAASDPLERKGGGDVAPPGASNKFPVRQRAQQAVLVIERRESVKKERKR